MKYSLIINIMICFFLMTISSGCERAEIQRSSLPSNGKITERDDDCNCPNMDDCCCSLTIAPNNSGEFSICGTTDGDAVSCSVEELCGGTIDGLEHTFFVLNNSNPVELFCMAKGTGLQIAKLNLGSASLVLTCQHGQTSPQSVNVVFTTHGKKFYTVNNDCEVVECD